MSESESYSSGNESDKPSTSKRIKLGNVAKHRAQKYRKEWEYMADFKGWLTEAKGKGKFLEFNF